MNADVMLLLEGTYPYTRGGVAAWVDQLVRAHPQLRFHAVYIGARAREAGAPVYTPPPHVAALDTIWLFEPQELRPPPEVRRRLHEPAPAWQAAVQRWHDVFLGLQSAPATLGAEVAEALLRDDGLQARHYLHSDFSWTMIGERYQRHCTDPSFVDYFWTSRTLHAPLWTLARWARQLPPARVYHSISTGYAGFLGALLSHRDRRPLILTEHGIYTKERQIDLALATWVPDNRHPLLRDDTETPYLRGMWARFFEWLGRFCYERADPIVSLYEANRQRQIRDGAAPERTRVIPNGIDVEALAAARRPAGAAIPRVAALIGRVVAIKDIKTFIRAMRRVANLRPDIEGWIVGPTDEDPDYAEECRTLIEQLGLQDRVKMLGLQRTPEVLPRVGVTVLSSISEALPLVVLESLAAGIPVISTDVGACRELIEGCPTDADDLALGPAGLVVPPAQPTALADAIVALLDDPPRWHAMAERGLARVQRRYRDRDMHAAYRQLYADALERA
ncbi:MULTISPECIES: GT4 family glycosyltransferase PelF [Tepidimonas]|jgi:glycosyltransferase involved in cell wall biosynthesis|uniref:Glycosyltransferase involved in cell wall biosynthesis n=2 Tax=Tepidimonas TaxID=114248 RepID=A0A4R3LG39_9BURK|nr:MULTISPECIES: GT4 family glycosyltransferase PelF [Tepidimonas]TCS98952.1 glycosyltransferase involved in cell wall biosynthesis [Tepidimonas ignava]TSE22206.1 N-acetyl-alpha-D-glucosaminyl L-malate synthase [Tepidimonas aquatica]TSE22965.1 N-acetyl-alpha-D-glucosaminyl L-malate synthase [Tepidimonas ignava]